MSGPPAQEARLWPLALLMPVLADVPFSSYDGLCVGLPDLMTWWVGPRLSCAVLATWPLRVPRSGAPSQPGPISLPGATFFPNGL